MMTLSFMSIPFVPFFHYFTFVFCRLPFVHLFLFTVVYPCVSLLSISFLSLPICPFLSFVLLSILPDTIHWCVSYPFCPSLSFYSRLSISLLFKNDCPFPFVQIFIHFAFLHLLFIFPFICVRSLHFCYCPSFVTFLHLSKYSYVTYFFPNLCFLFSSLSFIVLLLLYISFNLDVCAWNMSVCPCCLCLFLKF